MELASVRLGCPEGVGIILGQSHFVKTVEDLYEAVVTSGPGLRFGVAFAEASGPCLVRRDGNDERLKDVATSIVERVGAGHTFAIALEGGYPINVLNAVKGCQEVCSVFCATSNPVEVVVACTAQGRGVLGVIDGSSPKGVESDADAAERRSLLRAIGYKR
ncbi:MAG: adenosine-specific kinase [Candidatus Eisenbacteria bacterium]|nr:adenosine-specific kinase [Candidatus Eisenbacteria bacterium]